MVPSFGCTLTQKRFGFFGQGAKINREHRINEEIYSPRVFLIGSDGKSRGIVTSQEALSDARAEGLDLVEIGPKANPPVVKIVDYNKFRYEQEKHLRQSAKNTKNPQLKEVRLSFGIGSHDLEVKAKRAGEFLNEGHFVRVFINLRGRQNIFPDIARTNLLEFQRRLDADTEQPITKIGSRIQVIIKPKKNS